MKIICVTGAPGSDVNKVADIFFAAGVTPALPLRQDASFTLAGWHEKVIAAAGGNNAAPAPVHQPGRFWEQFATNLFMENMQQPQWAWADPRSVWLLDFWQQFEPNLHFVLVYTSPQRALAEALAAEREHGADSATLMAAWAAHQQEILRFHHRNPARTILVDAAECIAAPAALLDACGARWNLDLDLEPAAVNFLAPATAAPLVGYLAEQLRQTQPELQALQQELEASLYALLPAAADSAAEPDLFAAVEDYRGLRTAAAQAQMALREAIAQAEVDLREATAQSDLELRKATAQIDVMSEQVALHEKSIAALTAALSAAEADKSAQLEKAEALAILAATRKELDTARQGIKRLEDEQRTQHNRRREDEQRVQALEAAASAAKDASAMAKEAQQENELLLVQLHQVQEELEHYFLEHKSAVKQIEEAGQRWQRMLERNPDYCDYRALELLDADQAGQRTSWRFGDLNAGGRAYPELRFDIVAASGKAEFAFARDGKVPDAPQALDALTSAEWVLLPTLCRVLGEALQAPAGTLAQLDQVRRAALSAALAGQERAIAGEPAALRFDRVSLKREQVNPDYEHLWLQLGNLSLGEKRWGDVDFRLSCANVRPGKFGAHPKLEFPADTGAALLESWFAESFDDFGDKLELRFALPEAMDMSVWEKLNQADRALLQTLVARLPQMLARLDDGQARLSRPVSDWQQLAGAVQSILAARTAVAVPAPQPAAVPVAAPALPQAGEASGAGFIQKGFI